MMSPPSEPLRADLAVVAAGPVLSPSLGEAALEMLSGGPVEPLVREIEATLGLSVMGLFIFGSRADRVGAAHGEALPSTSDLDLLVVVEQPATGGIWGDTGSLEIDAHVYGYQALVELTPARLPTYRNARLLFDRRFPLMHDWLARLQAWVADNPDPWSAAERLRDHVWTDRMIRRIAHASNVDPPRAALYEARLLAEIAVLHNQAHARFNSSLSQWWRSAQANDQSVRQAVESYFANRRYPPDSKALEALFKLIRSLD